MKLRIIKTLALESVSKLPQNCKRIRLSLAKWRIYDDLMLIDYLNKEFRQRQKKNKSYSIRAFAKSLAVDHSTLSKILTGKRKLSFALAKKIVSSLKIDDYMKQTLLFTYDSNHSFRTDEDYFVPDEALSRELMSKWEYYTILSYLEIDDSFDVKKIARKLVTTEATVTAIIENLLKLGIITRDKSRLKLTGKRLTFPKTFNREALIKVHRENIEKSLLVLSQNDLSQSDFSGMTLAMSSKKFKIASERIKEFRRSLAEFLNDPK